MVRSLLICTIALFYHFSLFAQLISIEAARALPTGSVVTVRGVVTNGPELGKIRYMQDATAGIAAYPGSGSQSGFEAAVQLGDSIEVSGPIVSFQGLLEITPIQSYSVITSGNPPPPLPVSILDLTEGLEGQLVQLPCVTFDDAGAVFSSGTYLVRDMDGNDVEVYLRSGHPLLGMSIPADPVQLNAIVSSFFGVQLLPRFESDFLAAPCFFFSQNPIESDIQTDGFLLSWSTNLGSTVKIRYGATPDLGAEIAIPGSGTSFSYHFSEMTPGTIYWAQVEATHNGETIQTPVMPFATRSLSSGQIKVFFNHPIDESAAGGLLPDGQSAAAAIHETISRIDAAQQTIDVAMYNNSRDDLTAALKAAHARGVRVRYVAAEETENYALQPAPAFPVVYGNTYALMHNKFMVIDADLPASAWVMGGSMNWTQTNINNDYNNTLFIQDQSLARGYELEFEEMWGSDGAQPNAANQRFGPEKRNSTPHRFVIGGRPVESWFSPSDRATNQIEKVIHTADSEALFALLTFTKNEQADALIERLNDGVSIRGLIENTGDIGSEFNYLAGAGIAVQRHVFPGTMHHKYVVVDANTTSVPVVATGSHNWTFAAETENDENLLLIYDADIATLYKAEFEQRWTENITDVVNFDRPSLEMFPNPVSDEINLKNAGAGDFSIVDLWGRIVYQSRVDASGSQAIPVKNLPAGTYFALFQNDHGIARLPFQKI